MEPGLRSTSSLQSTQRTLKSAAIAFCVLAPTAFAAPIQRQVHKFTQPIVLKHFSELNLSKIAATYVPSLHALYVFNKPLLLKGIESKKYSVRWDGKAATCSLRFAAAGTTRQDDNVKLVFNAKVADVMNPRFGGGSVMAAKTIMVYNAKIVDHPAEKFAPQPVADAVKAKYPTVRCYRVAAVHRTILEGDGDDSGQMTEMVDGRYYYYSKADASAGFLGEEDAAADYVLSIAEWPNP